MHAAAPDPEASRAVFKDARKAAYLNPEGSDRPLRSPVPHETLVAARAYRLGRIREQLARHDAAGILLYDPCNIRYADFPARLFRISFTGELGFEVNVPARHGLALWERLWAEGQQYDICPYGTETMHVLRAEKGYIIVGQDTDGTLTPDDAGLSWAVGKAKPDFVGKRSLARPDMLAKGRKQLVGLLTDDPETVLEEGAQIVADPNQPVPMTMLGHVTSAYWSEALGRSIAMAVVVDGRDRDGQTLHIPMPDRTLTARVVKSTVFYDPEGRRLGA